VNSRGRVSMAMPVWCPGSLMVGAALQRFAPRWAAADAS
jgi:hypothetical protein